MRLERRRRLGAAFFLPLDLRRERFFVPLRARFLDLRLAFFLVPFFLDLRLVFFFALRERFLDLRLAFFLVAFFFLEALRLDLRLAFFLEALRLVLRLAFFLVAFFLEDLRLDLRLALRTGF